MLKLSLIIITLASCYCSTINNNVQHLSLIEDKLPNGNEPLINDEINKMEKNEWYDGIFKNDTIVGRTFGGLRRLKIAIPAIMYKLGVVTTMLGFLTLLAVKGVLIGLIILIIQLSAGLSKLHGHTKHEHGWGEPETWQNKIPQNIHVHVHGTDHEPGHYSYSPGHHHHHSSPSFWDRDRMDNQKLNLYASLTPYSAYNNQYKNSLINNKVDDDLLIKLKEYKELKELRDLRDSLYQQVV